MMKISVAPALFAASLAALAVAGVSNTALAQTSQNGISSNGYGDQAGAGQQASGPSNPAINTPPAARVTTQLRPAPQIRLFGMPSEIWAPVDTASSGVAYRTLGGQAETSADSVSEQVMQPR